MAKAEKRAEGKINIYRDQLIGTTLAASAADT